MKRDNGRAAPHRSWRKRTLPVAALAIVGAAVAAESACAAPGFRFSLSASSADPYVNTAPAAFGGRTVYLWLACTDTPETEERGLLALLAQVEGLNVSVLSFTAAPGVTNIGSAEALQLGVGPCPVGEDVGFLLGSWSVFELSSSGSVLYLSSLGLNATSCGDESVTPVVFGFATGTDVGVPITGVTDCQLAATSYSGWQGATMRATRFDGVRASISYRQPSVFVVGKGAGAWVGIATCEGDGSNRDIRWLQVGWWQDTSLPRMYREAKTVSGSLSSEILVDTRQTGEFGTSPYACYRDGNVWVPASIWGAIGDPIPWSSFGNLPLCNVTWAGEKHSSVDHFPGTTSQRVVFSNCKVAFADIVGELDWQGPEEMDAIQSWQSSGSSGAVSGMVAGSFELWDTRSP